MASKLDGHQTRGQAALSRCEIAKDDLRSAIARTLTAWSSLQRS
jgi:hypothetical protein